MLRKFFQKFVSVFSRKVHLDVKVHLSGGSVVILHNVKDITVKKTPAGNFGGYEIVWHDGHKPPLSSFALDHITAVIATKE